MLGGAWRGLWGATPGAQEDPSQQVSFKLKTLCSGEHANDVDGFKAADCMSQEGGRGPRTSRSSETIGTRHGGPR